MTQTPLDIENIIYQEMMSHPALFSHLHPKKVVIIGDEHDGIVSEVLKHENIIEIWKVNAETSLSPKENSRLHYYSGTPSDWANAVAPEFFDILISEKGTPDQLFKQYHKILNTDGILIQLSDSPFEIQTLKTLQDTMRIAGFRDVHVLSFPQPKFPTGWRAALMTKKNGIFRKVREKDIYNKTFPTRYYNHDVHKASLVMPEFMREELTI